MAGIIEDFYTCFSNLDADGMIACYHDEVIFEDPAFGVLSGNRAKNMWRMLCHSQKGKNFKVTFADVSETETTGCASWEAHYTFSPTGRNVHNIINAEFSIKDGKIIRHTDRFNLYSWAQQALGWKGVLLGWTPIFKRKLNAQTNRLLSRFEQESLV